MNKLTKFVGALLVSAIAVTGCGGSPTSPTPPPVAVPIPPSPPVLAANEVEIPRTLLEFGKPGAVFPITREISQAGTVKFLIDSDKNLARIDYYLFFVEADARACALLLEGGRGQGQVFEPACGSTNRAGWRTSVTGNLADGVILGVIRPTTIWGVFKNTDSSQALYSIWGKTRFETQ